MRTVQLTLDEALVKAVDRAAKRQRTSRSGLTRAALRAWLSRSNEEDLERRHRAGYENKPASEFSEWEGEQAWGDK
jgi:metal-responsive CopG/Arc/MetJ family transcriptional regulator